MLFRSSFSTKKPDPKGAQTILKETKSRPEETLMVGDSSADLPLTAHVEVR